MGVDGVVSLGITKTARTRVKTANMAQLLLEFLLLGSLSQSLSSSMNGLSKSVLGLLELSLSLRASGDKYFSMGSCLGSEFWAGLTRPFMKSSWSLSDRFSV